MSKNVAAPKIDTTLETDPPAEESDSWNLSNDSNIRNDADSSATTDLAVPIDQKDEPTPGATLPRGSYCNSRPNPNPNFWDSYKCIKHVSNIQLLQRHTEPLFFFFSFFPHFMFSLKFDRVKGNNQYEKTNQTTVKNKERQRKSFNLMKYLHHKDSEYSLVPSSMKQQTLEIESC